MTDARHVPDAPAVQHDSLPVHGNLVRYAWAGARTAPDGTPRPVVVLIHGIASRAAQWEAVMGRLAESAHVIAPDLLGHGESAKPRGDYSLGGHACGIRDLLAALGHDRISLVGHSLGGGIAMQFAYQFPERLERLVLVDSGGLGNEVNPVLRAATLPGAEYVMPLLFNEHARSLGRAIGAALGKVGIRGSADVRGLAEGVDSLADAEARRASSTPRARSSTHWDSGSMRATGSTSPRTSPRCSSGGGRTGSSRWATARTPTR